MTAKIPRHPLDPHTFSNVYALIVLVWAVRVLA